MRGKGLAMEPQYVMGVSAGRGGSAALLRDGRVVMGIDQTRLDPVGSTDAPGAAAIEYCLEAAGIDWNDIALLVESEVSEKSGRCPGHNLAIPDHVRRVGITRHRAHAYSAATPSTFHDAAVIVICEPAATSDAAGTDPNGASAWDEYHCFYSLQNGRPEPLPDADMVRWAQSSADIVAFQRGVSRYVFDTPDAGDRIAALAAHGRPGRLRIDAAGSRDVTANPIIAGVAALELLDPARSAQACGGRPPEHPRFYADVARWAQDLLEATVLDMLENCHARYPSPNLVYAGDLVFNTALNRRISDDSPFEQICVQNVAGDPGAAVGCCYYGWAEILDRMNPPQHDSGPYLGRIYPDSRIERAVAAEAPGLTVERPRDLLDEVVQLLAAGKTVGWYEGGSELGSGPLGHRSVLADVRSAELLARLDGQVPRQMDVRPPACVVRAEDSPRVVETADLGYHQVLSGRPRPAWATVLGGVTHVDGSAAVQCVTDSSHRRLHDLLTRWCRVSGQPVLANAPMGTEGRLVETPEQALAFLKSSALDALVMECRLIRKVGRQ